MLTKVTLRLLLGYPGAQVFSFDDGDLKEISWEETAPFRIVRRFLNDRKGFLSELFAETPELLPVDDDKR